MTPSMRLAWPSDTPEGGRTFGLFCGFVTFLIRLLVTLYSGKWKATPGSI